MSYVRFCKVVENGKSAYVSHDLSNRLLWLVFLEWKNFFMLF